MKEDYFQHRNLAELSFRFVDFPMCKASKNFASCVPFLMKLLKQGGGVGRDTDSEV